MSGGASAGHLLPKPDLDQLRRTHFPVTADQVFLNHSSYGPPTRDAIDASARSLEVLSRGNVAHITEHAIETCDRGRSAVATLLSCTPADIAFFKGTTEALALVALGATWRANDEVIVYRRDHPNVINPWLALESVGVKMRYIEDRDGGYTAADVRALIGPRTRAVALSWVQFEHGFRVPIEEIGALCRAHDVWFVVDAIQGLGVLELRAPAVQADVIAAGTYKWLLGGFGLAVAYLSPRARRELRVPVTGFLGQRDLSAALAGTGQPTDLSDDARRFESSTPSLAAIEGLIANIELLLGLGAEWVEARAVGLAARIGAGLVERGYDLARPPGRPTSIVSAWVGERDRGRIEAALTAKRVTCSRVLRQGLLRASPHCYNIDADADMLLAALDTVHGR